MTSADATSNVNLDTIKQELDDIGQELVLLPNEAKPAPAKRKGTRRDEECRWLDEAENMIQQSESEDTRWLDDAERDIDDTFLVGDRKGLSKKRNAIRKQMNSSIKLVDGKPFDEAARAVFEFEGQLNEAELHFGKESIEAAQKLLLVSLAYLRQRQFGLAEVHATRCLAIFNVEEGPIGCGSIQASMRLIHIKAMQGKWEDVNHSCAEAMQLIAVAPALTKELVDMVDQIALLTRIKCTMRHTPGLGTVTPTTKTTTPTLQNTVPTSKVTPL